MKKTLILSVLIGILLLGGLFATSALADENWLAGDPAEVTAVILHTNDVHVAFQDNIGYDGLALYKKELEAQYDHVMLIDAGCAQTSWVKDDGISTIGIALQEEVPSHL